MRNCTGSPCAFRRIVAALIHSRMLRTDRIVSITVVYVLAAMVLGAEGGRWISALLGVAPRLSSGSAIAILSAIASGMMAFTGIVLSLMFVGYQISSTFYTPRLVRVMGHNSGFLG